MMIARTLIMCVRARVVRDAGEDGRLHQKRGVCARAWENGRGQHPDYHVWVCPRARVGEPGYLPRIVRLAAISRQPPPLTTDSPATSPVRPLLPQKPTFNTELPLNFHYLVNSGRVE